MKRVFVTAVAAIAVVGGVIATPGIAGAAATRPLQSSLAGTGGNAIAVSGTTAFIGSQSENSYTGAVHVLTKAAGAWTETQTLTLADGVPQDSFGVSVAISGTSAIVGAVGRNG